MFSEEEIENKEVNAEEEQAQEEQVTEEQAEVNEVKEPEPEQNETVTEKEEPKPQKPKVKKTYTKGQMIFVTCISVFLAIVITSQILFIAFANINSKNAYENNKNADFYRLLEELQKIYDTNYLYAEGLNITSDQMLRQYVALTGDIYAAYYTQEQWMSEQQSMQGQNAGIGCYVSIDVKNNCIYINHVFKDSPAEKAGLKDKDAVIAVEGQSLADIGVESGYYMIAGQKGTNVTITVLRYGKQLDLTVTRGDYVFEPVLIDVIEKDNHKIGYVHIIEFMDTTLEEFDLAVKKLQSEYCEGIIIDLRNNPGGQLNSIVSMLDYIEPAGEIVQIYKKDGTLMQSYKSDSRELDMPLVVLCNESTASAAELMTRSLMDTGKAESYGLLTYGKGCGQSGFQLSNGSVVYITSFYYKTPQSDNYDGIGITPDHVVQYKEGVNSINLFVQDYEDDAQLQAALEGLYKSIIGD